MKPSASYWLKKDLGETSFVLAIEIDRDKSCGILNLSQKAYVGYML